MIPHICLRRWLATGLALVIPAVTASAQAPPNDFFATPSIISTLPFAEDSTTVGATAEPGEPDHAPFFGNVASNSVWWQFSPAVDQTVDVVAADSNFDHVISVWRIPPGSANTLAELDFVAGADRVLIGDERTSFEAVAGTLYYIVVDGFSSPPDEPTDSGTFTLVASSPITDPFATWIAGFPSLSGADAERGGNPAGDGVPNLLKLALGLDPTMPVRSDPNRGNLPAVVSYQGGLALQYTVEPENLGSGDVAIMHGGEVAIDLISWVTQAPVNTVGDTWVIPLPAGAEGQARLVVSDPN